MIVKCTNCNSEQEYNEDNKFCTMCGTVLPLPTKKCISESCNKQLPLDAKFCSACGTKQDISTDTEPYSNPDCNIGNDNLFNGDFNYVGKKEETHIENQTIIKNEDETKQVKTCHVCGENKTILEGHNCPKCGKFTCKNCFDLAQNLCKICIKNKLQNNEEKFIEALKEFLKDGIIDANERREIESLKVKYGISTEKANALEQELKPKTEKINFSTIEKLNLTEATEIFYELGNAKKSYELLEPIYKVHPYSEEVLDIYLPVLIKNDIKEAKKIISKTHIDILSMFMAEIEIAIIEKDLNLVERKLNQAKQLWQSNKLKYYEAWFYLELAKFTGKDTFVSNAEEIANNFDKTEDKLELSYQIKILKNIADYKGEDTSYYAKEFCKENNLYTSVFLGVPKIIVGKNQQTKTLNEALELINENGTVILEPEVYKEHISFNKKVKIVGLKDSIINKSSSELPIIVLDETKTCEISAPVEIEGVVFTHEKNLAFNNLQNYVDIKYKFDKNVTVFDYREEGFASCLLVNSDAKLKNVAVLDSLTYGITLANTKGTIEDSIISHCYGNCLYCVEKTEANVQGTKIINSQYQGILAKDASNPRLKNCEIYNGAEIGICVEDQASGTFEECYIHDNKKNGLKISDSAKPSFEDCKIHDNKTPSEYYPGVVVEKESNPRFTECEIYGHLSYGVWVKDEGRGTYKNCNIYDNMETGLFISKYATPSFEGCKIHDNKTEGKKFPSVVVKDSSNPSLTDCEIYNGAGIGIVVEGNATGSYKNCNIHNNKGESFSNNTSNSINISTS